MSVQLNDLITRWFEAKKQLEAWTHRERELRQELVQLAFDGATVGETHNLRVDHGMALVAKLPINYTVDGDELGKCPPELINQFIRWKPTLIEPAWRKATDNERKTFADVVTEKPGMPQLELKKASSIRKW